MDNQLFQLCSDIKLSIFNLKRLSTPKGKAPLSKTIIVSAGVVLTSISILWGPVWISLVLLFSTAIVLYAQRTKTPNNTQEQFNNEISRLETTLKALEKYNEDIIFQNNEQSQAMAQLRTELDSLKSQQTSDKDPYRGYAWALVKTMQRFHVASKEFGESCADFFGREIEETLYQCNLKFVDYSNEFAHCYICETSNRISETFYSYRAIVIADTNEVLIKGKVFIPKQN